MTDRFPGISIADEKAERQQEAEFDEALEQLVEEYLSNPHMVREIIAEDRGAIETALMNFVNCWGDRLTVADSPHILREEIIKEAQRIAALKIPE